MLDGRMSHWCTPRLHLSLITGDGSGGWGRRRGRGWREKCTDLMKNARRLACSKICSFADDEHSESRVVLTCSEERVQWTDLLVPNGHFQPRVDVASECWRWPVSGSCINSIIFELLAVKGPLQTLLRVLFFSTPVWWIDLIC